MTREQLKEYLNYNPYTGIFTWKENIVWKNTNRNGKNRKSPKSGKIAGSSNGNGYIILCIKYKRILAHRAAWIYINGNIPHGMEIDHINRNKSDNRIENLRIANTSKNQMNTKCKNKFGCKGIYFRKERNSYIATITVNRKLLCLKQSKNLDEVIQARKDAEIKYFGEFSQWQKR